jgi:aminopeptidase-like protein
MSSLHSLRYLHFTGNRNEPDRKDENFDRLWKIRDLFEILNATFSKFYSPSENLAIDEVIVQREGDFQIVHTKKRNRFCIKMLKLRDSAAYMYDMKIYLGKDRQPTVQHMTTTHATLTELTRK